jgi:nucleoside-diphosphate-sugar epimerase
MIVGNGLIGRALVDIDSDSIVFIASGVSDSKCIDNKEFVREYSLVEKIIYEYSNKLIVFFSTYSINDKSLAETKYVKHKKSIEQLIKLKAKVFLIVRVSNVIGRGGNPKNIFNFLFNCVSNEKPFELWRNSTRNLIMIDDFVELLKYVIENEIDNLNKTINIINSRSYSIEEIVMSIEKFSSKRAIFSVVNKESNETVIDEETIHRLKSINFIEHDYLNRILIKYFNEKNQFS